MAPRKTTMSHASPDLETIIFSQPSPDELNDVPEPVEEDGADEELESLEDAFEETAIQVEDMDPTAVLWEDGPTAGQTVEWKNKYGEVYVTSFDIDRHVMWRTLNRAEYKQIVRQIEQLVSSGKMSQSDANMYNEEIITEVCILYPRYTRDDFNKELAGLPSIISQQVLESSGFNSMEVRKL